MDFYLDKEVLYKRSSDGTLLRCLDGVEARNALREVHEGIRSTHTNRHMMVRKMQRKGYFWRTLEKDCIDYVCMCHKCQVRGDKINAPPALMFNLISPWPFAQWGIDVIGYINQKPAMIIGLSRGYRLLHKMGRSWVICSCNAKGVEEIC
jgi:Integrase zinc binding domain